jgi:cytochrome c2
MRSVLLGVAFLSACCATASAHGPGSHATPPTQEAIAAGDAARGGIAFEKVCSACHTIEKGARRRVGPNLFAVAGARIAQKEGYPYSEAFRKAGSRHRRQGPAAQQGRQEGDPLVDQALL